MPDPDRATSNQAGVYTLVEANTLYGESRVRAQLKARRWQQPVRSVVVAHNGALTVQQRMWVGLAAAPRGSMLFGLTAASFDGFRGIAPDGIEVVTPDHVRSKRRQPLAMPVDWDVRRRWSTKLGADDVNAAAVPPRTRLPRSIVDAAGRIESLPEREFDGIRRERNLPPPTRQQVMRRKDGAYYLDNDWDEFDVRVEIHGIPHMFVQNWDNDVLRQNDIAIGGGGLLVFTSYAVRHLERRVGDQLTALFRRRGWSGPS